MATLSLPVHVRPANPIAVRGENAALVDAFIDFRDAFAKLRAADPHADETPFLSVMDPADDVLRDEPAYTIAGVTMKLKRAFVALVGDAWSDDAVSAQRPADFDDRVRTSDLYQEMFWRAIEDLERMSPALSDETSVWDAALAEYRKAWALWDDLTGDYTDEESNAVSAVAHPALEAMIDTPVPNAAALVVKIEEARRDQRALNDQDIDAILADVRRLAALEGQVIERPAMCAATTPTPSNEWQDAWMAYRPISEAWQTVGDEADSLDNGTPEHADAMDRWRTNIRAYAAARETFMAVPTPTFEALAIKMRVADACDDDHHDICLADLERLIGDRETGREC